VGRKQSRKGMGGGESMKGHDDDYDG